MVDDRAVVQAAVELKALVADGHGGDDVAQRAAHHVVIAAGAAIGLNSDRSHVIHHLLPLRRRSGR